MINLGDNFSYQGAKPLDGRLKYDTVANMKAVADATMYDGCLAYCVATDKTYQWKSSNTVDETLGKWREFSSGGGGGAGSDTTAYHVNDEVFEAIDDSDLIPIYDHSESTKKNTYWTTFKSKLKAYFDTLYDKNKEDIPMYGTSSSSITTVAKSASVTRGTFTLTAGAKVSIRFTYANTASAPTLNVGSTGAKNIKYIASDGTVTTPTSWWGAGDVVTFVYDGTQWLMQPTFAMSGSSVTAGTGLELANDEMSIKEFESGDMDEVMSPLPSSASKYMNYSTEEQVVGQWIDGKTLYRRTYSLTSPATAETTGILQVIGAASEISVKNFYGGLFLPTGNMASLNWMLASANSQISDKISTWIGLSGSNLGITMVVSSGYVSLPVCVTIEYTKTT